MSGEARLVSVLPAVEEAVDEAEGTDRDAAAVPEPRSLRVLPLAGLDRVGVVLVAHSARVADAVAELAVELLGTGDPGPLATAGGDGHGGVGTSGELFAAAAKRADQGMGVAVLVDLGSAVASVQEVLAAAEAHRLPFPVRVADAPFLEGAVAAVATAAAGGDLAAVIESAEDGYLLRKL